MKPRLPGAERVYLFVRFTIVSRELPVPIVMGFGDTLRIQSTPSDKSGHIFATRWQPDLAIARIHTPTHGVGTVRQSTVDNSFTRQQNIPCLKFSGNDITGWQFRIADTSTPRMARGFDLGSCVQSGCSGANRG